MERKADLHLHTAYSDGTLTPRELLERVKSAGLAVVSVTDHDTVSAVDDAIAIGARLDIEVIPGVELSTVFEGMEVHILGYFIDYHNKKLSDSLAEFREARLRRAERIVGKLNRMNIPLSMESVLATVTGESVGRPHIANALVNGGHASSYHQAFSKYIGDGRPAYEKKDSFSPEETVDLISQAGGLSFLAHPGRSVTDSTLLKLIQSGLDGIEVVHPSHTPDLVRYYRGIVNEYCLLESGGSDYHGGPKEDDQFLGGVTIPVSSVDVMRRRLVSR
jgi:3',5'-nucleoside bisphosphate phosphatase